MGIDMEEEKQFWFNTKSLKVEEGFKSAALYRIGPFTTHEEAARALETVRERTKKWEAQEREED